jgi:Ferritin-like domain
VHDNDDPSLTPEAMLTDLLANNQELIKYLRATHDVCDKHSDVATASLIENWIDETESWVWFLYEILHRGYLQTGTPEEARMSAEPLIKRGLREFDLRPWEPREGRIMITLNSSTCSFRLE